MPVNTPAEVIDPMSAVAGKTYVYLRIIRIFRRLIQCILSFYYVNL